MRTRGTKRKRIIALVVNNKLTFDVIEESSHNAENAISDFLNASQSMKREDE